MKIKDDKIVIEVEADDVHWLVSEWKSDDEGYHAAVVLLAALEVGQRPKSLSEFTGYDESEIKKFSANLRASNVWNRGRTYHSGWDDEKNGGIAFWMDTAIAQGLVERA